MNTSLRSNQTQRLVKKSLRAALDSKNNSKTLGSLVSWNGNSQTAVGSTRKASLSIIDIEKEEFPMKLAHFIQRRYEAPKAVAERASPLQEKWAKLANLTMDPSISEISDNLNNRQPLPHTLTEAMNDHRPCMIASLEDPFTIVNVNQAWCDVYGYTKDEVLNQNFLQLIGGGERSSPLQDFLLEELLLLNAKNHETFGPPILHYARDGTPMKESFRLGSLSIGADVSDRYLVCVTEMEPPMSQESHMITNLDDGAWGAQAPRMSMV